MHHVKKQLSTSSLPTTKTVTGVHKARPTIGTFTFPSPCLCERKMPWLRPGVLEHKSITEYENNRFEEKLNETEEFSLFTDGDEEVYLKSYQQLTNNNCRSEAVP